jgi:hypothetical protein
LKRKEQARRRRTEACHRDRCGSTSNPEQVSNQGRSCALVLLLYSIPSTIRPQLHTVCRWGHELNTILSLTLFISRIITTEKKVLERTRPTREDCRRNNSLPQNNLKTHPGLSYMLTPRHRTTRLTTLRLLHHLHHSFPPMSSHFLTSTNSNCQVSPFMVHQNARRIVPV